MSRLTDEELSELDAVMRGDAHPAPVHYQWCATLLAEVREHRAAQLTAEEVEALRDVRREIGSTAGPRSSWVRVLDKLLAAQRGTP